MTGDGDRPARQSPVADCIACVPAAEQDSGRLVQISRTTGHLISPPRHGHSRWSGLSSAHLAARRSALPAWPGCRPFRRRHRHSGDDLLSGAMHEDGLADMADGFGGGHDVESTMRIMHDSRIGSYGVLALILATAMRLSLLMVCLEMFGLTDLILFMAMISAASRFQPVIQLAVFPAQPACAPCNADRTSRHRPDDHGAGALGAGSGMAHWPIEAAAATAVPAMAASLWIGGKAVRRVEGLTGDVMGATTIIAEIIMLMCWITAGSMLAA